MFKLNNKSKNNSGFTIIEIVIALFVLTVAVIGVYNAFSLMVITTSQMTDRFTAAYLAQEGIEIIRNIRDYNWISDRDWISGFDVCYSGCEADYTTGTLVQNASVFYPWEDGTTGRNLNIDTNSFYSYRPAEPGGMATKFRRRIKITPISDSDGVYQFKVSVTVFWDEKKTLINPSGSPGSITAEDYLYNWY